MGATNVAFRESALPSRLCAVLVDAKNNQGKISCRAFQLVAKVDNAWFAFALRAGHDIDGEDSTEERCPIEPISFVFLRPALLFGEHVEGAALVRITCGATYRIS